MEHHIDIVLQADAEMQVNRLLNTVYSKLHKALYDLRSTSIGVSFPRYHITLGNVLRLHGNADDLGVLQQRNWLSGIDRHCNVSDTLRVPDNVKYRTISRKQTTMSQSKLKRLIKRGSITENQTKTYKSKMFSKGLDNPYIELVSGSNGEKHRRYIEFGEKQDKFVSGEFDQFGLSKTATVPWF